MLQSRLWQARKAWAQHTLPRNLEELPVPLMLATGSATYVQMFGHEPARFWVNGKGE